VGGSGCVRQQRAPRAEPHDEARDGSAVCASKRRAQLDGVDCFPGAELEGVEGQEHGSGLDHVVLLELNLARQGICIFNDIVGV